VAQRAPKKKKNEHGHQLYFLGDYLVLSGVLHVAASSQAVARDGHKNVCDKVNTCVHNTCVLFGKRATCQSYNNLCGFAFNGHKCAKMNIQTYTKAIH